jgi:hypothetical protein
MIVEISQNSRSHVKTVNINKYYDASFVLRAHKQQMPSYKIQSLRRPGLAPGICSTLI